MRQKLDIADVEERTKIRAKYLRALENEEWGLLPGPTFVKTFLRTYAEVVGVDPYLLVEEYRLAEERNVEPELQALAPMSPPERRDRGRGPRRLPSQGPRRGRAIAAALAVALVGFLLLLGLLGGGDEEPGGSEGGGQEATPAATTPDRAERLERRRARERQRRAAQAPTGVQLSVAPVDATYVCVDRGPGTDVVVEDTLDAPRRFRDPRMLRINLGKRSATVTLNGEPVALEPSGDPIALELTPEGASELDSSEAPCA